MRKLVEFATEQDIEFIQTSIQQRSKHIWKSPKTARSKTLTKTNGNRIEFMWTCLNYMTLIWTNDKCSRIIGETNRNNKINKTALNIMGETKKQ